MMKKTLNKRGEGGGAYINRNSPLTAHIFLATTDFYVGQSVIEQGLEFILTLCKTLIDAVGNMCLFGKQTTGHAFRNACILSCLEMCCCNDHNKDSD